MKASVLSALLAALLLAQAAGCSDRTAQATPSPTPSPEPGESPVSVALSDSGVTVDGSAVSNDASSSVLAEQPLYGTTGDSASSAVVITQPGTYVLSGTLSDGQVAVDLGESAADDPDAVVTLILDGVDITCSSAPALVFQNVYECADTAATDAASQADTSAAGARVVLADGSENTLISTAGDAEAALTTAMSLNLSGQEDGDGLLTVTSASAGISGSVHLTLDGGRLIVQAQKAGLQAKAEALSVITVNGGKLFVNAGQDGTSDGVASQGYVVVNDGELVSLSAGEGLSAAGKVQIQGGSVLALGSRVSPVDDGSRQASLEWTFSAQQDAGAVLSITDAGGSELLSYTTERPCTAFLFSSPQLTDAGSCTVSVNDVAQENASDPA